jgi:hypothetical protein
MKMVKSAFLASAAGLVAMSGAQAADLPVKAKPVEYVKVCSLYGAGFYYIPGTDICMKVGGYIRWQETANPGANISAGPMNGTGGRSTRLDSQDFAQRTRALATFDTRQQTAYGTLRTYLLLGFSQDSTSGPTTAPSVYMTRGFIQIAGFTFGKATSFFDFTSTAAVSYNAGMLHNADTGDAGHMVAAYTAQFGNGVSATISAEQTRRAGTVFINEASAAAALQYDLRTLVNPNGNSLSSLGSFNTGQQDIVAALRIDQAWGSAQVSVAAHDVSAGYYGTTELGTLPASPGHPSNKWGFAASGGLRLNAPMIGPGDYFQIQGIYSQGATGYLSQTPRGAPINKWSGDTVGYGFWDDAVFSAVPGNTGGAVELTTGWSVFGSYEHFWTPALRTSVYGSYINMSYNGNARETICSTANAIASGTAFTSTNTAGATGSSAFPGSAASGCNPNWSMFNVGTRSQWNVTKDLYVGLDVIYQKLNSASPGGNGTIVVTDRSGGKAPGTYQVTDQDAFTATWRIHRDIVP